MAPISRDRDLKWIPVRKIVRNDRNPRRQPAFEPEALSDLRRSIATHGVLQPILVEPYVRDEYKLVDGERRLTTAELEGLKEVPAIVVGKMSPENEVITMYNVHALHERWEMVEQLAAIKWLKEQGRLSDEELAIELGMSLATFKNRLRVLDMGDRVFKEIASGDLDYSSALRADEAASTVSKRRPDLVKKLGGESSVERKLLEKAKARKGISQELVEIKKDLADTESVPDAIVEEYLREPKASWREVSRREESLQERRKVEGLGRDLEKVERELRHFDIDLAAAPNLKDLRRRLSSLIDAAQALEGKVQKALLSRVGSTA